MISVCGPQATIEDLRLIEPITPENAGRRWKAIQHGELVDTIKDEVLTRGWKIDKELYTTAREGVDMAGALLLNKVNGIPEMPDMSLALGFINSNSARKALTLTVGASVTCCTNGLCTGSIILNRVHDHTVNLMDEVDSAINRYAAAAANIPAAVAALRERELSPEEACAVLMEAGRRELVGWAAIGRVDKEYRNPTFGDHGKNTSWALYNAFTYAARKNINPINQMATYNTFRALLPGGADLN